MTGPAPAVRLSSRVPGQAAMLAVLAAALGPGCSGARGETAAAPPVPVIVAMAVQRDVPVEIRAIGTVEPLATVAIRPQVSGQIDTVHFGEGADVRAGDLLFTIDPRPYQATLAQAESNLARDRAQAKNAQAEARRGDDLFTQGILSKEQYESLHASAQALDAAARADEATVESARLSLAYCTIHSPISGRTGSVLVKAGNVVKAIDGGPLVTINQIDPIHVAFAIPEARFGEVKAAANTRRLTVEALVTGEESRPVRGELSFLDNEVDRGTGTVRLRGRFANPERRLWPGQFVNARLAVDVRRRAVVVPSQAIQDGQSGRYVFVMKADRTVEVRNVVVGPDRDGETVVEKGLTAGETVVTDGQIRLAPGAKVEPKAEAKGAAS